MYGGCNLVNKILFILFDTFLSVGNEIVWVMFQYFVFDFCESPALIFDKMITITVSTIIST